MLAADFTRLGEEVRAVDRAGSDWIHLDIMDGRFVPDISFGPNIVQAIRRSTDKPLNVHLMVIEPERSLERYRDAGADHLLVQAEPGSTVHLHRVLSRVPCKATRRTTLCSAAHSRLACLFGSQHTLTCRLHKIVG